MVVLELLLWYQCFFFFSSRRRHTRCGRDWSSDVCSSDLQFYHIAVVVQSRRNRLPPEQQQRCGRIERYRRQRKSFEQTRINHRQPGRVGTCRCPGSWKRTGHQPKLFVLENRGTRLRQSFTQRNCRCTYPPLPGNQVLPHRRRQRSIGHHPLQKRKPGDDYQRAAGTLSKKLCTEQWCFNYL